VEFDDETAARLERVAPARSRKRPEFIRPAIRKALWELEEQATAEAYRKTPDQAGDALLDPKLWEQTPAKKTRTRRAKKARRGSTRYDGRTCHCPSDGAWYSFFPAAPRTTTL
jgi:hypothetical protein